MKLLLRWPALTLLLFTSTGAAALYKMLVLLNHEWAEWPVWFFSLICTAVPLYALFHLKKKKSQRLRIHEVGVSFLLFLLLFSVFSVQWLVSPCGKIGETYVKEQDKNFSAYYCYQMGWQDGDYEWITVYDESYERRFKVGWSGNDSIPPGYRTYYPSSGVCDGENCEGLFKSPPVKADFKDKDIIIHWEDGSQSNWGFL